MRKPENIENQGMLVSLRSELEPYYRTGFIQQQLNQKWTMYICTQMSATVSLVSLSTKLANIAGWPTYSLLQKKRTFNSEFFCGPPWWRRPEIHMVDYVNYIIDHVNFLPSSTRGAKKKFGIKCVFLLEQTVKRRLICEGNFMTWSILNLSAIGLKDQC